MNVIDRTRSESEGIHSRASLRPGHFIETPIENVNVSLRTVHVYYIITFPRAIQHTTGKSKTQPSSPPLPLIQILSDLIIAIVLLLAQSRNVERLGFASPAQLGAPAVIVLIIRLLAGGAAFCGYG